MSDVRSLLNGASLCRAVVVGDLTLDFYINIDAGSGELSVETGLPTRSVSGYGTFPGGAGNVAVNLAALGVKTVSILGVTGDDMFGYQLLRSLEQQSIDIFGMVCQKEKWDTPVYTKIINDGIEEERLDFGNFNKLQKKTADAVISNLEKVIEKTDIVIINQQLKSGIHTSYFIQLLVEFIKRHNRPIYITDSRDFPEKFTGSCRKINVHEARNVLSRNGIREEQYSGGDRDFAQILYSLWNKPVFLTRGEKGIMVHDRTGFSNIPGISLSTTLDTVGAGDTTLAGISAALGAGFSASDAAKLGNLAASVTVQKLHTTGTATREEILNMDKEAVYIYNPELAADNRKAVFWNNSEIEIIRKPETNWIYRYALFDHDGTLSTLREGWEHVMEPMMMESITGEAPVPHELYEKILNKVRTFIDKTTGVQTLIQMKGLVNLVQEFNLVQKNQIHNEFEYKKIYNERLMRMVERRTEKFKKGELNIHDVTIKNAVPFLEEMHKRGTILFLASGTDRGDVLREAELLGYADLFTGGIFGATDNVQKEPKKIVINTILEKIGRENSAQILAFGDGPVEIAETKRAGGCTIGIASDEIRRYGLNRSKRTRLIRAGADIIIPDYSEMKELFTVLEGVQ